MHVQYKCYIIKVSYYLSISRRISISPLFGQQFLKETKQNTYGIYHILQDVVSDYLVYLPIVPIGNLIIAKNLTCRHHSVTRFLSPFPFSQDIPSRAWGWGGNTIWTRTGAQGSFHFENVHLIGNRQAVCEKILPTCSEMNCELKLGKCLACLLK